MIADLICTYFFSIIDIFCMCLLCDFVFKVKTKLKTQYSFMLAIFFAVLFIIDYYLRSSKEMWILPTIEIGVALLILIEGSIKRKLLIGISSYVFANVILNSIPLFFMLLKIDAGTLVSKIMIEIIYIIIVIIICIVFEKNYKHETKNIYWGAIILAGITMIEAFLIIGSLRGIYIYGTHNKIMTIFTISIVAFILTQTIGNYLNNYLYEGKKNAENSYLFQIEANKSLMKYMEIQKEHYETLRQNRHDMMKHIDTLSLYAEKGNIKGISEYLKELGSDLSGNNTYYDVGNECLSAIISTRYSKIINMGAPIAFKVDGHVSKKIDISDSDLNILIGNLLDNSIEECLKSEDSSEIVIRITEIKDVVIINIINPIIVSKNVGLTSKIKLNNNEEQGLGLKSVERIVNKYENIYLNVTNENGYYEVKLMLAVIK